MKDFKEMESIELKDFGIRVNPYLTYAQVQAIANSVYTLRVGQNVNRILICYCLSMLPT